VEKLASSGSFSSAGWKAELCGLSTVSPFKSTFFSSTLTMIAAELGSGMEEFLQKAT
jgi:hypothetical protein